MVPAEGRAVREWLVGQGFRPGDLRRLARMHDNFWRMCPMARACDKGQLGVCKWLYDNGVDIHTENDHGFTCMHKAGFSGHLHICKWLLEKGGRGQLTKKNHSGLTPLSLACGKGYLDVCQWFSDVGGVRDIIAKDSKYGATAMVRACEGGHLLMCKWLVEVGACPDVSMANELGDTPMLVSCREGQMAICHWLYGKGAAKDITRANNLGMTPLAKAVGARQLSICQWLFFNGAVNNDTEHVSQNRVQADIRPNALFRPELMEWVQGALDIHETFLNVFLQACVLLPANQQELENQEGVREDEPVDSQLHSLTLEDEPVERRLHCRLPCLPRGVLQRVASILGVETGRRLRTLRELKVALDSTERAPSLGQRN